MLEDAHASCPALPSLQAIMGVPYIMAACVLSKAHRTSMAKALVILILLSRFAAVTMIGLDLVTWPPSFRQVGRIVVTCCVMYVTGIVVPALLL